MQSSTKKNLLIAACYAATMVLGLIIGPKLSKENLGAKTGSYNLFSGNNKSNKVGHVLTIIEENYVDPVKIDSMQNLAINQILKKLDPHSSYLPPVDAKRLSEDLDGNYNGVGIEYQLVNDTVLITSLHQDGPAAKAGLLPGDRILSVNDNVIAGQHVTPKKIVSLIKGRSGTEVSLLIRHGGIDKQIPVKRDKITISSIDAAYALTDKVGYIKIGKFGARTDDDFEKDLYRLQKQGINSLILDLRGNGGGYLNAATALADQFLPEKKLIVYTQGEHEPRTDYRATDDGLFETGKLVVLIDEHSASASEIFAGAIQDLDRGIIIGRRSFGKGLVQEQFNFGDGSALNLTVARYFTPSGRSIQKPYTAGAEKYNQEVGERYKNGELQGRYIDSMLAKNKRYKTSGGRLIYGGGGISPDLFIPVDTTEHNSFYYALNARGILNEFIFNDLIGSIHPNSINNLMSDFKLTDLQYKKLVTLAQDKAVKFSFKDAFSAKPAITSHIKALVARYYFGDAAFFQVKNVEDKVIARALEILSKP